jgi:hypothetical protein
MNEPSHRKYKLIEQVNLRVGTRKDLSIASLLSLVIGDNTSHQALYIMASHQEQKHIVC